MMDLGCRNHGYGNCKGAWSISAASGVNSPIENKIPPSNSANPAKKAIITPGFIPIDSNQPPVPFNP